MDIETKSGYVAGVVSIIVSALFGAFAINVGWDLSGQILTILAVVFALLGVGSIWKPTVVGPVAAEILKNMGQSESEKSKSNRQHQSNPNNSPQAYTDKGNVNITQHIYGSKKRRRR